MDRTLTRWLLICALLGVSFLLVAESTDVASLSAWDAEGIALLRIAGAALAAVAALAALFRAPLTRLLAQDAELGLAGPRAQLFWISFAALFIEVMLIRYCNA